MTTTPLTHSNLNKVRVSTSWMREAEFIESNPGVWFKMTDRSTIAAAGAFALAINDGRKKAFRPVGKFHARSCGLEVHVQLVSEAS